LNMRKPCCLLGTYLLFASFALGNDGAMACYDCQSTNGVKPPVYRVARRIPAAEGGVIVDISIRKDRFTRENLSGLRAKKSVWPRGQSSGSHLRQCQVCQTLRFPLGAREAIHMAGGREGSTCLLHVERKGRQTLDRVVRRSSEQKRRKDCKHLC
jgi:hypothetical protein